MRTAVPIAALAAFAAVPAAAQSAAGQVPEALTRVTNCRTVTAAEERLACYDREVAALQTAQSSGQIVAMDRQQVRRTRQSLFGLALPNLDVFGDHSDDEAARIESTIRSATQNGAGKWIIELEDGARWVQVDSRDLSIYPRSGHNVRIRRASMGSYLANIAGQVAIRVRRIG